jgi:hypothetical protein
MEAFMENDFQEPTSRQTLIDTDLTELALAQTADRVIDVAV